MEQYYDPPVSSLDMIPPNVLKRIKRRVLTAVFHKNDIPKKGKTIVMNSISGAKPAVPILNMIHIVRLATPPDNPPARAAVSTRSFFA